MVAVVAFPKSDFVLAGNLLEGGLDWNVIRRVGGQPLAQQFDLVSVRRLLLRPSAQALGASAADA